MRKGLKDEGEHFENNIFNCSDYDVEKIDEFLEENNIYIVIIKQVLSMDNIASLFVLQKATYTLPIAYDYFCSELEKTLVAIFENKEEPMKESE